MKRAGVVGVVLIAAFVTTSGSAWAGSPVKLCVPKAEERPTLTPKHGKCRRGYKLTTLGAEGKAGTEGKQGAGGKAGPEGKPGPEGKQGLEGKAGFTTEQAEQLKALLPYVRFVGNGAAGMPTVQFSGVNVQIVNGEGKTESANGEGNLVIGYDEEPGEQTGSHNLILGLGQTFTSYGGIVAGEANRITEAFASVTGGVGNLASGVGSSVSGGAKNQAAEDRAWVGGGVGNTASGFNASVTGGVENLASFNGSSVSGGRKNTASGEQSSVSGGKENNAKGKYTSIFGGHKEETTAEFEAKP